MGKSLRDLQYELATLKAIRSIESERAANARERSKISREIFELKHPSVRSIKKASSTLYRNVRSGGSVVGKKFIGHSKKMIEMRRAESSTPVKHSSGHKKKTIYTRKLVKNKKGHYVPKYVAKRVKVRSRSSSERRSYGGSRDVFGNPIDTGYIGGGF